MDVLPAIGRVGVFSVPLEVMGRARGAEFASELEELGYGAIWTGEGLGTRELFTNAAGLLAGTRRIVFGAGIANIWARDPVTTVTATRTLDESYPGRFLLGLGISHREQVDPRGHVYARPLATMRAYLDAMDGAAFVSPLPGEAAQTAPVPRILAALRPPMLQLAAERADGAHPYMTIPEATATARGVLGQGKLLAPEQAFLLETDTSEARRIGRAYLHWYLGVENFRKSLLWQGFTEDDLDGGGSDRLVDAIVAWGDEETVRRRVAEHHDAGADHVCVQAVSDDPLAAELEAYRRLAPALADL
ncbi:MAG: TIGR03620 family F420-dependent LLM class oxidoreductase [Gaiella sp.]